MKKYLIYIILVCLIVASFFIGKFLSNKEEATIINNLIALQDSVHKSKLIIDGLEQTVFQQKSLILTQKEAIDAGFVREKILKALNIKYLTTITKLEGEINILEDSIAHTGVVVTIPPKDSTTKPQNAIILPFTFSDITKNHTINGSFDLTGKLKIGIKVPLDLNLYGGIDKKGIPKFVITTTNEEVTINGIKNISISIPKPHRISISGFAGYGVLIKDKIQFGPVIGIGINYTIFRF